MPDEEFIFPNMPIEAYTIPHRRPPNHSKKTCPDCSRDLPKHIGDLVYARLNLNEIRVVTVHPGAATDHLTCSLNTVQLQHHPSSLQRNYEALSYVWGCPARLVRIRCYQEPEPAWLAITESLEFALLNLRNVQEPRTMWIDSICIDQDNHEEKGDQIKLMANIYSRASTVVIWQNEPRDRPQVVPTAIRVMNRLAAEFGRD
jgi:hypothetical protein